MSDKIFIAFGLGGFNTSPGGVLEVIDGTVKLNKVKEFNEARVILNAGANYRRILRRGIWSIVQPFDWEDDGYWPLMREYVSILHQPYQNGGPGAGARVLFEIFDGCSESWFYDPANYEKARQLIRASFANLGNLGFIDFGIGNEVSAAEARMFCRDCVLPEFKSAGRVPFSYGASYIRQNPFGSPGPVERQKQEAETCWDEPTALSIFRPVHGIKDENSINGVDTLNFWIAGGNPIRVWRSNDGVWDGENECDRVLYNGLWQIRPSPAQTRRAVLAVLNAAPTFFMPGGGSPKFAFEVLGKKPNAPECWALNIKAISEAYAERFGALPDNYGRYPDDWVEPIPPPEPPIPPPVKKCKCSYWLEKGGDGKRDWKRWWDCVFGDGPKRCK